VALYAIDVDVAGAVAQAQSAADFDDLDLAGAVGDVEVAGNVLQRLIARAVCDGGGLHVGHFHVAAGVVDLQRRALRHADPDVHVCVAAHAEEVVADLGQNRAHVDGIAVAADLELALFEQRGRGGAGPGVRAHSPRGLCDTR